MWPKSLEWFHQKIFETNKSQHWIPFSPSSQLFENALFIVKLALYPELWSKCGVGNMRAKITPEKKWRKNSHFWAPITKHCSKTSTKNIAKKFSWPRSDLKMAQKHPKKTLIMGGPGGEAPRKKNLTLFWHPKWLIFDSQEIGILNSQYMKPPPPKSGASWGPC